MFFNGSMEAIFLKTSEPDIAVIGEGVLGPQEL